MGLKDEIVEQPTAISRLLQLQSDLVKEVAGRIRERNVDLVLIAARGTSDNAGLYAKYLWGAFNRLPVALAAPSLFSVYETPPAVGRALVVGISQSGQSPDIVRVLRESRRQGALTLAITNSLSSPLAEEAELCIDTLAGPELAVAATKTYSTQLTTIAMLSAALTRDATQRSWIDHLPEMVEETLALDTGIKEAAARYRYMDQCAVLGRGFNYATAFEWSLKLKELAYVVAEPYSPADFQHGPMALACPGYPIFAVVPGGKVFDEMRNLITQLLQNQRVELLAVSNEAQVLAVAHTPLQLPDRVPEWLSPIPAIVPAQLFCYHLTRAKGYDTEDPRGISKITQTW
jgi:glucosamine--fructose-6-phosphate aminotransferase (isomerizing)